MKPKVSVIIPTYMEEKYIGATLDSLKEQRYRNFEVIVSDSNSKDKTVKIARKYTKNVVVVKKRGIALGRNVGAKHAKGDILLFLDADTELMPNFIEKVVFAFHDPKVVATSGMIRCRGKIQEKFIFWGTSMISWSMTKLGMPAFYGTCLAVRKSVFKKMGGFSEEHETAEDIDFAERASKLGKCVVLRSAICYTSPRRLKMGGALHAVLFHIQNYFRYKISGHGARNYPVIR